MPELPEVETIRRAISPLILGQRLRELTSSGAKMRRHFPLELAHRQLVGRTINALTRQAKFLLLHFEEGDRLLVHFGMSGRFAREQELSTAAARKHIHVSLHFDGEALHFIDPRRFGFVDFLPKGTQDPSLQRLGLDPLRPDFATAIAPILKAHRRPLKTLLLDQSLIGGVGNIYANEALWHAQIKPSRRGCDTSLQRLELLGNAITQILHQAIAGSGTTLRDFALPGGEAGGYFEELSVYGRQNLPCLRCGKALQSDKLGGRQTTWCKGCQR